MVSENGVKEDNLPVEDGMGEGPRIIIDGTAATYADYMEVFKANPGWVQSLTVVVQKRLLAEKDAEIARLTELTAGTES